LPIYYGWVVVVLAAVAMTATLPGRTHGLGLISKQLTEDPTLGISELRFGMLNFWAVLIGAAMCLPVGWLIDRFGVRVIAAGVTAGLGLSVLGMSQVTNVVFLFITLVFIRGLGQGSLSVVSMAMIGKWFTRRLPMAMGVFTVLLAFGFVGSNFAVGGPVQIMGWRPAWAGLGWTLLLIIAPLFALALRSTPEVIGLPVEKAEHVPTGDASLDLPLLSALLSPAFWAFTLATGMFNFVWSAITLFNQSILEERHFKPETSLIVMGVLVVSGLPANLIAGWLATRWSMGRLLTIGMVALAASLLLFPFIHATWLVIIYATMMGVSGGIITVVFFSVYGHAFGRASLGSIQGTVQVLSVFASALGQFALPWCKQLTGSYSPLFFIAAPIALLLGAIVWVVPMPMRERPQLVA
jgi:MFS family permease